MSAALAAVPRARFLPGTSRRRVAADVPVQIGFGQTNSQPSTVAAMVRLLDVRRGDRVLDVGSGSGWTTALLAWLTGPSGTVAGVELIAELAARGAEHLAAFGLGWAGIRQAAPGVLGLPDDAPYDRILVSADGGRVPHELVDQLADGGRMVLPVSGEMTLLEHRGGDVAISRHGRYRFVPLR